MRVPICDTCPCFQSQDYEFCNLNYNVVNVRLTLSDELRAIYKGRYTTSVAQIDMNISKVCKLQAIIADNQEHMPHYIDIPD